MKKVYFIIPASQITDEILKYAIQTSRDTLRWNADGSFAILKINQENINKDWFAYRLRDVATKQEARGYSRNELIQALGVGWEENVKPPFEKRGDQRITDETLSKE